MVEKIGYCIPIAIATPFASPCLAIAYYMNLYQLLLLAPFASLAIANFMNSSCSMTFLWTHTAIVILVHFLWHHLFPNTNTLSYIDTGTLTVQFIWQFPPIPMLVLFLCVLFKIPRPIAWVFSANHRTQLQSRCQDLQY